MDLYFSSVGRNSVLLLNIPPNREGLISDADVRSLQGWRKDMDSTFGINLAAGAAVSSPNGIHPHALLDGKNDTWWTTAGSDTTATITFALAGEKTFDVLSLQEQIRVGQRVEQFTLEYDDDGQWKEIASGMTIGYKRLIHFTPVTAHKVRLRILSSRLNPTIGEFGLYKLVE
jgi:alpha-L-fucosidase